MKIGFAFSKKNKTDDKSKNKSDSFKKYFKHFFVISCQKSLCFDTSFE